MNNTQKYSVLVLEGHSKCKECLIDALASFSRITFHDNNRTFTTEIARKQYDLVFIHVNPDNKKSLTLLETTCLQFPYTPIIIISTTKQVEFIDKAIRTGAQDFIAPPFSPARIKVAVQNALKKQKLQNELDYLHRKQDIVYNFDGIIAESQNLKAIIHSLKKFARTDATILFSGKTGTGKSFLSGTVHYNSPRREYPFIKINCANIPDSLLESELFGHEKGSFTGADKQRIGRFEQANGGTIFLDEIGEIPLGIQAKLLRVIEEKSFERVGGNKTIKVDVRIIAASNKDLPKQVKDGHFREDLYYRINVLPIALPTLKKRPQCIIPLAESLLQKSASSIKRSIRGFTPNALDRLKNYEWPGNIRQLANIIERAVILEEDEIIHSNSIHLPVQSSSTPLQLSGSSDVLEEQEKQLILKELEANLWVQKNAAEKLGISPRALNYKIKKLGITHPNWRKHKTVKSCQTDSSQLPDL